MANKYNWVDDPCISGKSPCDTDVLNEDLMHIKYDVTDEIQKKADDAINEVANAVAVQRIYDCGISTDTKGFEIVNKLAHSTFDLSKFTVVGSPTITDDGIASGFSNENYILTPIEFQVLENKSWIIDCMCSTRFPTTIGQTTANYLYKAFSTTIDNSLGIRFSWNGSVYIIGAYIKTGDASSSQSYYFGEKNLGAKINSDVIYSRLEFDFTLGQYNFYYKFNYNDEWILSGQKQPTTENKQIVLIQTNPTDKIAIGQQSNTAIDLKQFLNTVDGVPVFNGNKTGLYVAKPDNYTVEGSPTITDDGILTNCPSQNDYLSATIPSLSQFEKVRIEFELKVKEVPSSTRGIFNIPNDENPTTANSGTYAWLNSVGFNINLAYNGDSDNGTGSTAKYPIAIGDFIKVIAEGNKNSVGSIKVSKNNGVFNDLTLTQSNACNFQEATKLFLGITGVGRQMQSSAEFDINSFKIYGDGNLIYQPCLKIPYTEAFEHSKVVGVAYRNRVQDLYEQTGEALFYTLDEQNQNFTLPMGDIYGMITKNREILDIVYPIGRPMPEENNVLLDNEVWLEGATVNIVDYPKLFKVYGTKYGGDGTTTFKLPDMRGRTLWGSPDGSNGYIEAKLPNIKGSCGKFDVYEAGGEGCFIISSQTYGNTREQWGGTVAAIGFDASLSNSIYSDDATTVQPPAFKVRWKTRFE